MSERQQQKFCIFYIYIQSDKTGVINDPLDQTHNLSSSEHCFHLKYVLFC